MSFRRHLLCRATVVVFALTSVAAAESQPNIILMMGDDHGWEETGYNEHPHVKTPVLDAMAKTAFRFEHFYSGHPTCSPTRASFLTGRHPNRMGTFTPGWSLRPEEITMAHLLRDAGYRTAHFGKWHLGAVKAASPVNPGAMGFDEWVSHDNFFEMNPPLSRNGGPPEVIKGESSEIVIREAMQFIGKAQAAEKPFFTVVWFGSPHEPYSGLPEDLALYDELPAKYPDKMVKLTSNETGQQTQRPLGEVLRERYAEITAMDRAIGQLRDFLAEEGLRDNTLLFYCGDNGTPSSGSLVTPHRGLKGQVYEGGTLVPGLIEWPARIPQPRSSRVRASTSDLLPTVCALTGLDLPDRPLDGIDLTPALDGDMTERPSPLYFWMYDTSRLSGNDLEPYIDPELQKGTTPLVKYMHGIPTRNFTNFNHPTITKADYRGARTIIKGRHKLVIHDSNQSKPKVELFDLVADRAETKDQSQTDPETVKALKAELKTWQESVLKSLSGADYEE